MTQGVAFVFSGAGQSFRRLMGAVLSRPMLLVAMTLYWIWVNMGYQTSAVLRPMNTGIVVLPSQMGPILMSVVAYALISVWFRAARRTFRSDYFLMGTGVLMSLSALMLTLWVNADFVSVESFGGVLLYVLGSIAFGISSAVMCIELQRVFGCLGSEHVLFHGSIALLGSVIVVAVLSVLPVFAQQVTFIVVSLAIPPLLIRVRREFTKKSLFERGASKPLAVPKKLLYTSFLHGMSYGVLLGTFTLFGLTESSYLMDAIFAYAVAAVFSIVAAITLGFDFDGLLYQIGFPIVALGMYLSLVIGGSIGVIVQLAGFCFLHLTMWGVCAFLIKRFDMPCTWVIGVSTCLFMMGQLVGSLLGVVVSVSGDTAESLSSVLITCVVVFLGSSLYMMSSKNLRTGWGLAKADSRDDSLGKHGAFAVETMASEYSLTAKELDVLVELAKGKNRRAISEDMCVSPETVKTHIQHIYRKCDVHSSQDLIRLLERFKDRVAS